MIGIEVDRRSGYTTRGPTIIELTQRGVRDALTLTAMTLKEFKYY